MLNGQSKRKCKLNQIQKCEEYLEKIDEEKLLLWNMIRIEGDIYKLVPFFQHGDVIYATEKIILKQTRSTLLHGSGKLPGNPICMRKLNTSAFSGLSFSSIFSHGKS